MKLDGKLKWSSGSATADTNLYRSASNVLKTDDSFEVASGQTYKVDGADVLSATSLGSSVISSSLRSVGSLTSLTAATPNFTGPLTSSGASTFTNTLIIQQSLEKVTAGGNLTGTTNIDLLTSAVVTYTSTGAFTFNFRGDGSSSLNDIMSANQAITAVIFVTNTTARSLSAIQIQGTTSGVTTRWFGGSAPSGNASATDVYTVTIIKTGSATYTVYASQSKFA